MDYPGDFDERVSELEKREDAELAALRDRIAELERVGRRLLEASGHSSESDWLGDDEPWDEMRATLAKQNE